MNNREGVKDLPIFPQGLPVSGWFIRRFFYPPALWRDGGPFSVKVAAIKRNANQSSLRVKGFYDSFI